MSITGRIRWRRLVAFALAIGAFGDVPVQGVEPGIGQPAVIPLDAEARRVRDDLPELVGPVDHVAIVGDSLYFEGLAPNSRTNTMIDLVRRTVRRGLDDSTFRLDNRSRPGLSIRYTQGSPSGFDFVALYEWITMIYRRAGNNPDVVVLAATSIDLNIRQEVEATELAPLLVDELDRVVDYLDSIGIQAVVVPAFGINDAMFDGLKSLGRPAPVRCFANARVTVLNDALAGSGLPMLFTGFTGTDLDNDGDVDERNFTGYDSGRFPDDGIHTNTTGEALIGRQIASRLVGAIAAAST